MKTRTNIITGMAILLFAGISMNAFAGGDPFNSTTTTLEERADVSMMIKIPSNTSTQISVLDQEGDMIYSDIVTIDDNPGKTYDFSEVERGAYTFIAKTEFKTVEKTFVVENNELRIVKEETSYRPVFSIDGDILKVSYLNKDKDDIHISLEGASLQHFKEYGGNDMAYGKILNIKNLPKGEYALTLKAGWNTYNYYFNK